MFVVRDAGKKGNGKKETEKNGNGKNGVQTNRCTNKQNKPSYQQIKSKMLFFRLPIVDT